MDSLCATETEREREKERDPLIAKPLLSFLLLVLSFHFHIIEQFRLMPPTIVVAQ